MAVFFGKQRGRPLGRPSDSQVLPWISAPHLGQVMMTLPLPTGTRQMVLQRLQVKYLCSVSARRALAAEAAPRRRDRAWSYFWFSAWRL